jgi:asparagine synthase (glutamine-hydrolysing)
MGKKPLYYTIQDGTVVFSSELKSIYELSKNKSIDYKALQDYFTFGYIPTPRTIYNNIFKLEPACYALFTKDDFNKSSYWDVKFNTDESISYSDAKQNVESLLDKAVERRLVSDVPFGAFLSGGIDSSVVVSMMQKHLSVPVKTFSIGFDVAKYNELDDARKISKFIGTEHTEFVLESNCTDIVHEFTAYYDEPFGDSSSLPTYFVSKLAKDHVKMVLTGDGGDEIFGGYKRYSRQLINNAISRFLPFPATASALLNTTPSKKLKKFGSAITRACSHYPYNYLKEVALSSSEMTRDLINTNNLNYDSYESMAPLFTSQGESLNSIYYGDIKSYMLDDILVKVDRMSMANSIEVRSPFLDVDLIEYSSKLPVRFKTSVSKGKLLLRDIASKYVPNEIVNNKKKGFAIPLKEWFNKELKDLLIDLISSNRSNEILNYDYIDTLIDEHANCIRDNSEILWLVLCFEIWCREYHNA